MGQTVLMYIEHQPLWPRRFGRTRLHQSSGDAVAFEKRDQFVDREVGRDRAKIPHLHLEIWYRDIVRDARNYFEPEPTCTLR
jgi:hypothetical protein